MGQITIGDGAQIHPTARINVQSGFIGDRAIIGEHVVIEGAHVEIGDEAFIDAYAWIGGGSCFDPGTHLRVGDFLHMGRYSHINFALPVEIGHEFGCGMGTKVFSHGAYLSAWDGFPVQWAGVTIGDRVWMPHAWVNPGVTVGSSVVIAAQSLVNKDLPDGCLAGGIPAKVLRENVYPVELSRQVKWMLFRDIFEQAVSIAKSWDSVFSTEGNSFLVDHHTLFDVDSRKISGPATSFTEILKNQLRRNGIRFRYIAIEGEYRPWAEY